MINHVVLVGRLATDGALRHGRDGLAISAFAVAVPRPGGSTEFLPVVAFRRLAERTQQYLTKGRLIGVEGRLASRTYETSEGEKRRVIEIVAGKLRFLDAPPAHDAQQTQPAGGSSAAETAD